MDNAVCIGYMILALEALEYTPEKINAVALAAREQLDTKTEYEAEEHFFNSPY